MSKKSWNLSRRSFLRGAGVAVALPYMEGMSWAAPAREGIKRLGFVYFPNGCSLPSEKDEKNAHWRWFPKGEGSNFQLTRVQEPLEPFRSDLHILGGLSHPKSRQLLGHLAGDTWLTAGDLRSGQYKNSISVDQLAAQKLKQYTRYPSLVMSVDGGVGYKSRVSTLSFDPNGRPIPSENNHRAIFERYFAPQNGSSTQERKRSLARGKKVVDMVLDDSHALKRRLGTADQDKLDQFLTSLNSVEEQVRRNERWLLIPMKPFDASKLDLDPDPKVDPAAVKRTFYDLMVLAYQTDLTRVITYMIGREDGMGFGDHFPRLALGVKRGLHTISHDKHEGHWDQWGPYDRWQSEQFAYFLKRMKETNDEQGSLLDSTAIVYGSCCSTTHNANNHPMLVAGGKNLGILQGRYTRYTNETPLSNLFVSLLNAVDIQAESFADSTGTLPGLRS